MRPVCVKCGREMWCKKNGVVVYHPYERSIPGPVTEKLGNLTVVHVDRMIDIDTTKIDFIVHGDKYKCPACGYEVVTGFGSTIVDGQWSQEALKKTISKPGVEVIEILRE